MGGNGGFVIPIEVSDMAVRSGETDAERDFEESKNHGHLLCRRRHFFCSILRSGATQTERGSRYAASSASKKCQPPSVYRFVCGLQYLVVKLGVRSDAERRNGASKFDVLAPYREPRQLVITWR